MAHDFLIVKNCRSTQYSPARWPDEDLVYALLQAVHGGGVRPSRSWSRSSISSGSFPPTGSVGSISNFSSADKQGHQAIKTDLSSSSVMQLIVDAILLLEIQKWYAYFSLVGIGQDTFSRTQWAHRYDL